MDLGQSLSFTPIVTVARLFRGGTCFLEVVPWGTDCSLLPHKLHKVTGCLALPQAAVWSPRSNWVLCSREKPRDHMFFEPRASCAGWFWKGREDSLLWNLDRKTEPIHDNKRMCWLLFALWGEEAKVLLIPLYPVHRSEFASALWWFSISLWRDGFCEV